ncbi:hypothetical protein TruAng_003080 [Truncatella angustata]|nr:hypothetical protein TruAng_003080 [Truncatella angustata]
MPPEIQTYALQPDGHLVLKNSTESSAAYSSADIVAFLTKRLPYSLPILRRLQLGRRGEETLLITTSLPLNGRVKEANDPKALTPDSLYTMAVIDRAGYPSTEIWPFSSLELYHGTADHEKAPQMPQTDPSSFVLPFSDEVFKAATSQLLAVLSRIPITNPQQPDLAHFTTPGTFCCLAGNVHTTVAALLAGADLIIRSAHEKSHHTPYGKYLFPLPPPAPSSSSSGEGPEPLPQGLEWSTIGPGDFAGVMAANKIVRSAATIAGLHSAAVRDPRAGGRAVAFAFASTDGSVRTLHVDPAYRRRGLARAVVLRLLRTGRGSAFGPPAGGPLSVVAAAEGEEGRAGPLAFTGVEGSNVGSIKTFEAVGGRWYWDAYWLWLDLGRVEERIGV